jgi:signal transduction histidine kinase/CheY-like chemotaxis protein
MFSRGLERTKGLKAEDLSLDKLLTPRPDEGLLETIGGRCLLADAVASYRLVEELEETVGAESARALLTRYGFTTGYQEATRLRYLPWEDDTQWLLAAAQTQTAQGVGKVTFDEVLVDRSQGLFRVAATARASYEAEQHKDRIGPTERPVCHRLVGYLSGYASAYLGDEVIFVETSCAVASDDQDTCRLEGRLVGEWGAEGDDHRRLYQRERIGERLAERDREVLEQAVKIREQEVELTAKRKLEEASRLKSEFLANISHELRTPLNSIIGYADLLLTKIGAKLPAKPRQNMERILSNAEHLLGLINRVLDISKIEAGRMDLHPEVVRLGSLLERCAQDTRVVLERDGKPVQVVEAYEADLLPPVWADEVRLRQCLTNLLANAAKFTDEGEVRIEARTIVGQRQGRESRLVSVSISDTGVGIPREKQALVFEPFRQVDASAAREKEGTGLGLPIVRQLLSLMGGEVRLTRSVAGQGSTFTLIIPVVEDDATPAMGIRSLKPRSSDERPDAPERVSKPRGGAGNRGTPRVLLIDDDPDFSTIVREIFAGAQGPVGEVHLVIERDPVKGIAHARQRPPAVILLDLRLPKVDGREVLRLLREHEATRHVPVVVTSIRDDLMATLGEGAQAALPKPVDRDVLIEVVAGALAQQSQG